MTNEQQEFIRESAGKKYISEIARKLGVPRSTIYNFLIRENLNFKRVKGFKKAERFFPEGCFNPHEHENWLF